jgi:DNA (cytosine-5)-methyltransferase 1
MNYYNEFDPFAAAWLRELISRNLIPNGHVDTRSISDVRPSDLEGYTQCHFFAGIGGWSRALELAGWPSDRPVWTGSCPCQPFSVIGRQEGESDTRHLWPVFAGLIRERKPPVVFGEQVASEAGRNWFCGVRSDLEEMGYAAGGADLCAAGIGAPHIRQRIYWVGVSGDKGLEGHTRHGIQQHEQGRVETQQDRPTPAPDGPFWDGEWLACSDGRKRKHRPEIPLLAYGIPARVGRLRGYGNAIVPHLASEFIQALLP